ncbi:MAG: putative outer rane adhesin like protein [Thermoleophilia bacterium]|nr:putative outer rane adhesin like protein [Thermoleophilia bacterium]
MIRFLRCALLIVFCTLGSLLAAASAMAEPVAPASVTIGRATPSDGTQFPINWQRPAGTRTGYSWVLDHEPTTEPDLTVDTTDEFVILQNIGVGVWYAHVRTIDAGMDGPIGSTTAHSLASEVTGPPTITITSASVPAAPLLTATTSATFAFTYTFADRSTCQLDSGAEAACTSPVSLTGMTEGPHTITIRSRGEGQRNAAAFYSWYVDTLAPTVTIRPSQSFKTAEQYWISLDIYDSRGVGSLVCTMDGKVITCPTGRDREPFVTRGTHMFVVVAIDTVGNSTTRSVVLKRLVGPANPPTAGADRLLLTDENESLSGLAGNDYISGLDGVDRLFGGAGNDTILGGEERNFLVGEAGNDRLVAGPDQNSLDGGPGNDTLTGGKGTDELKGQAGRDTFVGGASDDSIVSFDKGLSEVVNCGAGFEDEVWADRNDRLIGCEIKHYSLPKRTTITSPLYDGLNADPALANADE